MLSEVTQREWLGLAIVLFVYRIAVFVGLLAGCVPDNRASFYPAGRLSLDVGELDFRETPLGTTANQTLSVSNLGTELLRLELALEPSDSGFALSRTELSVGRESRVDVQLRYSPLSSPSEESALLFLRPVGLNGDGLAVELLGSPNLDVDGDGQMDERLGGLDCNDNDARVFSGSVEQWYDGVDQNCDKLSDFDQDGDGFERIPEGLDCDDTDPLIAPDRKDSGSESEVPGVDDDCDGAVDEDAVRAGDLIVSELFPLPGELQAAYIEIVNQSDRTVYLDDWVVTINGRPFTIPDGETLLSGQYLLFCDDAGLAKDWGCDFEWSPGVAFGAASGSVEVESPTLSVDSLKWNSEWGFQARVALELSATAHMATDNDDLVNWCGSVTALEGGGFGSPGQLNGDCPVVAR